jgi:very-short-patch-repair endonuclease
VRRKFRRADTLSDSFGKLWRQLFRIVGAMHKLPSKTMILRARDLRANATRHERHIWRELRIFNQQGFHFRRQAPFRNYILDFVDHSNLVVIELDGGQHGDEKNRRRDEERD